MIYRTQPSSSSTSNSNLVGSSPSTSPRSVSPAHRFTVPSSNSSSSTRSTSPSPARSTSPSPMAKGCPSTSPSSSNPTSIRSSPRPTTSASLSVLKGPSSSTSSSPPAISSSSRSKTSSTPITTTRSPSAPRSSPVTSSSPSNTNRFQSTSLSTSKSSPTTQRVISSSPVDSSSSLASPSSSPASSNPLLETESISKLRNWWEVRIQQQEDKKKQDRAEKQRQEQSSNPSSSPPPPSSSSSFSSSPVFARPSALTSENLTESTTSSSTSSPSPSPSTISMLSVPSSSIPAASSPKNSSVQSPTGSKIGASKTFACLLPSSVANSVSSAAFESANSSQASSTVIGTLESTAPSTTVPTIRPRRETSQPQIQTRAARSHSQPELPSPALLETWARQRKEREEKEKEEKEKERQKEKEKQQEKEIGRQQEKKPVIPRLINLKQLPPTRLIKRPTLDNLTVVVVSSNKTTTEIELEAPVPIEEETEEHIVGEQMIIFNLRDGPCFSEEDESSGFVRPAAVSSVRDYGEHVLVVGSLPELGEWDPTKAERMFEEEEDRWSLDVNLTVRRKIVTKSNQHRKRRNSTLMSFSQPLTPSLLYFEYKYAVRDPCTGRIRVEDVEVPRRAYFDSCFLTVPIVKGSEVTPVTADSPVTVHDIWEVMKIDASEAAEVAAAERARLAEEEKLKKRLSLFDQDLNIRPDDRPSRRVTVERFYTKMAKLETGEKEVDKAKEKSERPKSPRSQTVGDLTSATHIPDSEIEKARRKSFINIPSETSRPTLSQTKKLKKKLRRTIAAATPISHFFPRSYNLSIPRSSTPSPSVSSARSPSPSSSPITSPPISSPTSPVMTRTGMPIPTLPLGEAIQTGNYHSSSSDMLSPPGSVLRVSIQMETDETRVMKDVATPENVRMPLPILFGFGDVPNCEILKEHLKKEGRLDIGAALKLISKATKLFKKERNVLHLHAPIAVFGDVHGQFYDLLHGLDKASETAGPIGSDMTYLFLGDYVDRGFFSTEIVLYLFALKIRYPKNVYLLRGNHECRLLTAHFDFRLECYRKYNATAYEKFMEAFDSLPLAAVLVGERTGTFLALHGGLSPSLKTIKDIEDLDRFREPPESGPLCDVLWSDPVEEGPITELPRSDLKEWFQLEYIPNSTRGCGYFFGYKAMMDFLITNDIMGVIRGHEVQPQGYLEQRFGLIDLDPPPLITVFSAPNYCNIYGNKASFLVFTDDNYRLETFSAVPHPYCLPNFVDGITYSFPFVVEKLAAVLLTILKTEEEEEEDDVDRSLHEKIRATVRATQRIQLLQSQSRSHRANALALEKMNSLLGDKRAATSFDRFQQALEFDFKNEKRPQTNMWKKFLTWPSRRYMKPKPFGEEDDEKDITKNNEDEKEEKADIDEKESSFQTTRNERSERRGTLAASQYGPSRHRIESHWDK